MASTSTPSHADFAVLFVSGSWHVPAHFVPAIDKLHQLGISAYSPRLPTNSVSTAPNSDLTAPDRETAPAAGWPDMHSDVKVIRAALDNLIVAHRQKVLVVAHSSGGSLATEAVTRDYAWQERQEKGEQGGVIGIFYVAAALNPVGVSFADLLMGKLGNGVTFHVSDAMHPVSALLSSVLNWLTIRAAVAAYDCQRSLILALR